MNQKSNQYKYFIVWEWESVGHQVVVHQFFKVVIFVVNSVQD